jgi:undecaprenyl-diphosphatase
MTWWQALVLGIVEGVTEYLPVSSTGHLLVAQRLLGLEDGEAANAYAICIQAGAIVAVLGLYVKRVRQLAAGLAGDVAGRRLAVNLAVAFGPAAVIGVLLDDWIESVLFGPWPIVVAWTVGAFGIFAFSAWARRGEGRPTLDLDALPWSGALWIGLAQCVAMWPGTSRSLVTIVAGVLVGLSLPAAVEFAFLLGVVTLGAATVFKGVQHGDLMLATYGIVPIAVGFVAAWGSAVIAVRWMVAWLNQNGLQIFGWWRLAAAAALTLRLLTGRKRAHSGYP